MWAHVVVYAAVDVYRGLWRKKLYLSIVFHSFSFMPEKYESSPEKRKHRYNNNKNST